MKRLLIFFIVSCISMPVLAEMHHVDENNNNDCHRYPMKVSKGWLQNNNIVSIQDLNLDKTMGEKLSSEKIKKNLWNNVFRFIFIDKSNNKYELITRNVASDEECSISDVEIYMISKGNDEHVGDYKQYY